jgi:CBS domain-containing protein
MCIRQILCELIDCCPVCSCEPDVLQLVQKSRALEANARPAIVCVRATTRLVDIIKRLAATGLHRVYVLDDHEKPVGVISLRDLIRLLLSKISDKEYSWQ